METSAEFGQAAADVLAWMGLSPETAGAVLGINSRTLAAMCQGIVPMRSLVIRFASEVARRCVREAGSAHPDWWNDVDAWLQLAGYPPRREGALEGASGIPPRSRPPLPQQPAPARVAPPPPGRPQSPDVGAPAPRPGFRPPAPTPPPARSHSDQEPPPERPYAAPGSEARAGEVYRPVYERMLYEEKVIHIFWIQDGDGRRVFQIVPRHDEDYKARAAQVKQDLAQLSRTQFERKYRSCRVEGA